MIFIIVSVAAGVTGCSDIEDRSWTCSTPADDEAPADVTITAQDARISPEPGVQTVAWTFDGAVPGPIFRLEIGQVSRIKLTNDSPRPTSLHFHGVEYDAVDDGSAEHPESVVNPGCAHVYTVTATKAGMWPYHSHVKTRIDVARGLIGALVVASAGEPAADHEFVAILGQLGLEGDEGEEGKEEEGAGAPFFMTINGGANGHVPVIERSGAGYAVTGADMPMAMVGDLVRWRVASLAPDDAHTFHLHGHTWCDRGGLPDVTGTCPNDGVAADNVTLLPAQGVTLEYIENAAGEWMYHCHVADHVVDGMWGMYQAVE